MFVVHAYNQREPRTFIYPRNIYTRIYGKYCRFVLVINIIIVSTVTALIVFLLLIVVRHQRIVLYPCKYSTCLGDIDIIQDVGRSHPIQCKAPCKQTIRMDQSDCCRLSYNAVRYIIEFCNLIAPF